MSILKTNGDFKKSTINIADLLHMEQPVFDLGENQSLKSSWESKFDFPGVSLVVLERT